MPRHCSEAPFLVERHTRVIPDVHMSVVVPRPPFAGEVHLRMYRATGHQQQQEQRDRHSHLALPQHGSLARQSVGSHPEASSSFLKCECMMSGSLRYCGSITTVVTSSQVLRVYGSVKRSKYSSACAFPP